MKLVLSAGFGLLTVFAVFALGGLAACTTMQSTDGQEATARTLVEISTMVAIEKSSDREATAAKIVTAAGEAKALVDVSGVSLDQVAQKARERIAASNADLSEKAALNALVNMIAAEFSQQLATGAISPEVSVRVNKLLDWIIGAARSYAP